ncbi:hypothetical protein FHS43_006690 [Streptosporangium becharense]|uniref:Uncharacterized protein n=1 Tax=Streptosporangium becharense TaxID=1816182 RepID=A0A7W9IN08_9ACTN|nr:hypothetical protein [Streptosporangium becharense]MBB2915370.1 hypothetical protein [Streptosporangium becharense]MBB5823744.1 hypothetical protein [Streptosporangium becharense]
MPDGHTQEQLTAVLDALDERLPGVRYRMRRFPDGVPYLRLTDLGTRRAALFLRDGRWVYLGEDRTGTAFEDVVGRFGDPPERVVGGLAARRHVPAPRPRPVRLARALGIGLVSAAGAWIFAAVIIAVLIPGDSYDSYDSGLESLLDALTVVAGLGVGWWLALRSWLSP